MIKCNLKLLMARKDITRKELSEETDIGLNSIGRYINNEFVKFDKEHMDALCKYFDCDISDLITFENENKKELDFYNTLQNLASSVDAELCLANHMSNNIVSSDEDIYYITEDDHVKLDNKSCPKLSGKMQERFESIDEEYSKIVLRHLVNNWINKNNNKK